MPPVNRTKFGRRCARLLSFRPAWRSSPVPERADTEQAVAQARAALGDPHWLAAIEAGRSLSVELAIAEAILP